MISHHQHESKYHHQSKHHHQESKHHHISQHHHQSQHHHKSQHHHSHSESHNQEPSTKSDKQNVEIVELIVSDFGPPPPHKRLHKISGSHHHKHLKQAMVINDEISEIDALDAYTNKLLEKTTKLEAQFDKQDKEQQLKKTVLAESQKKQDSKIQNQVDLIDNQKNENQNQQKISQEITQNDDLYKSDATILNQKSLDQQEQLDKPIQKYENQIENQQTLSQNNVKTQNNKVQTQKPVAKNVEQKTSVFGLINDGVEDYNSYILDRKSYQLTHPQNQPQTQLAQPLPEGSQSDIELQKIYQFEDRFASHQTLQQQKSQADDLDELPENYDFDNY